MILSLTTVFNTSSGVTGAQSFPIYYNRVVGGTFLLDVDMGTEMAGAKAGLVSSMQVD